MAWRGSSSTRPSVGKQGSRDFAGNARLKSIFQEFDEDNSGFISASELRTSLKSKFDLELDHDNALLLLQRFDENGDGEISESEFVTIIEMVLKMKKNFDDADLDGSNAINVSELHALTVKMGMSLDEASITALVTIFDEDKSGEIEYQEFFNLALFTRELQYQYEKRVKDKNGKGDFKPVLSVLGTVATSSSPLLRFLQSTPNPSFDQFVVAVVKALQANKERYTAPRVLKVRAPRKKAPTRGLKKTIKAMASRLTAPVATKRYTRDSPFMDSNFSPSPHILGKHSSKVTSWRRPIEITSSPALFVDGVDEGDVIQGALGNCWFLGALSVVAAGGTNFIEQSFLTSDFQGGRHVCRFFKNGKWVSVEIDDRLPCGPDGRPAFASCKDDNEFWVPLIEKAYAKLHGGYGALDSGTISYGLRDLTGEAVEQLRLDEPETLPCGPSVDEQWNMFKTNISESFLMGCEVRSLVAMAEEKNSFGLLLNHAYGIIDAQEIQGHRLVRLRNPWGNYEWTGPWSDGASEWTPQLMAHFGNYEFDNDGTFFMCFDDFRAFFNSVHVLRLLTDDVGEVWTKYAVHGTWDAKAGTSGGYVANNTWPQNHQFRIIAPTPNTRVFMCVSQDDQRYERKANARYEAIGIDVLRGDGNVRNGYKKANLMQADQVKQSLFLTARDNSVEFLANPSREPCDCYTVIPSTYKPGVSSNFVLTIYTQHPCQVEELQGGSASDTSGGASERASGGGSDGTTGTESTPQGFIRGEWTTQSAGGCMNHPTWLKNPQFAFTVLDPGDVTIRIRQENNGHPPDTMGLYLFDAHKYGGYRINSAAARPVFKTQFINLPEISTAVKITEAGHYYMAMPCTFEAGVRRGFFISISSNSGQLRFKEAVDRPSSTLDGEWAGRMVGGSMNHSTWRMNPRYGLGVRSNGTVEIFLERLGAIGDAAIGMYIFKDKKGDGKPDIMHFEGNSKFTKLENVTASFQLAPGNYIVLPCTDEPKHSTKFRISVIGAGDGVTFRKL